MTTSTHPYFGSLSTADLDDFDVIWERELPLGPLTVETALWADADTPLATATLDDFATLLGRLPEVDGQARAALTTYLTAEDSYLTFHVQEMEGGDQLPTDPAAFAAAMVLHHVGLWLADPDKEEPGVVLDYLIDPEHTDEILAVKLTPSGEHLTVAWES